MRRNDCSSGSKIAAQIPVGDGGGSGPEVGLEAGEVDARLFAAHVAALDRDRPHQDVAGLGHAFQARQHARQNVEVAGAADFSARGVDGVESGVGRGPDDRREQPRERGRALQRSARLMDAGRPVLSRPRVMIGRRRQGLRELEAPMRDPGTAGGAHA